MKEKLGPLPVDASGAPGVDVTAQAKASARPLESDDCEPSQLMRSPTTLSAQLATAVIAGEIEPPPPPEPALPPEPPPPPLLQPATHRRTIRLWRRICLGSLYHPARAENRSSRRRFTVGRLSI